MEQFDMWILLATLAGVLLGAWHLCWMGARHDSARGLWSRRLGVGSVLWLGVTGLVAAWLQSRALAPSGLFAGMLIVAMLWERPALAWEPSLTR